MKRIAAICRNRVLFLLFDKTPRDSEDERKLAALVKAEKTNERAHKEPV